MKHSMMLPGLIRDAIRQGSRKKIVKAMGYKNQTKGLRRLDSWLAGEALPRGDQVMRLAQAIGIDSKEIDRIITADKNASIEAVKAKRAQDLNYYFSIRYLPAFYKRTTLPVQANEEDALKTALDQAKRVGFRCCLNTPTSKCFWISADGRLEHVSEGSPPSMAI